MADTLTVEKLLERIEIPIALEDVPHVLLETYDLGVLLDFRPLPVGYEEVNCLMQTDRGKFIVKIFSKLKDLPTIGSNVRSLMEYHKGGIPVPKLHKTRSGTTFFRFDDSRTYAIVMDYFEGSRFTEVTPSHEDKLNIARILSRIHSLEFDTHATYDSWLTVNFVSEYREKKKYLTAGEDSILRPVAESLEKLDSRKFPKSIVHYDLHRENAMKNTAGEYCILDLASTDFNFRIHDVATYLALFCTETDSSTEENRMIYHDVLAEYMKHSRLDQSELNALPILVNATFAANYLQPVFVQKTGTDENPAQTIYYKSIAESGLRIFRDVTKIS